MLKTTIYARGRLSFRGPRWVNRIGPTGSTHSNDTNLPVTVQYFDVYDPESYSRPLVGELSAHSGDSQPRGLVVIDTPENSATSGLRQF